MRKQQDETMGNLDFIEGARANMALPLGLGTARF